MDPHDDVIVDAQDATLREQDQPAALPGMRIVHDSGAWQRTESAWRALAMSYFFKSYAIRDEERARGR